MTNLKAMTFILALIVGSLPVVALAKTGLL